MTDSLFLLFEHRWAFAGFMLIVGLCVGSFLNVVIYRLPQMLERQWAEDVAAYQADMAARATATATADSSVPPNDKTVAELLTTGAPPERFNLAYPASACTVCKAPIRWWQNVPVLSYLALRGRCACGKANISLRYPAVELLNGLLSGFVAYKLGFGMAALGALILTWYLVAAAFIDADTTLLPDVLTLPLMWFGIAFAFMGWGLVDLRSSVVGAMAGYLVLWGVYWAFKLATKKEGMGYGDFKLLAALGAWMGWQSLPAIVLISAVVGSVIGIAGMLIAKRGRDFQMPFGPYLAIAGFIALFWGQRLFQYLLTGN